MYMKQPLRKGSVLDALILARKQDGARIESTAMSATDKWIVEEKLAKSGTVNSA